MGVGNDTIQQVNIQQTVQQQPIQQQPIQQHQHDQLPQALIAQQERERQEQMRREQRLVPKTGVKAKAKKMFTGKTREKAFGVTEEEVNDHFSEERSQAFNQELQRKVEEDMSKTYHKGFHKVLKKIGEYVKRVRIEASYDDQQSAFREVTDAIRDYLKRYEGKPNPDAAHRMGLERINMYRVYFETITNGSLQVPEGQEARKIGYTEDAGKTLKMNTSMSSLAYNNDASKECLFPHEPKVGDIQQRNLGDCYLLSGLASLVKDHPSFIKQSMCDDGKGHVTVRFFKKGYDHTDELPEKEKGMLLAAQTSELQTMKTEELILKLLTSLSNDLLEDIKFVTEIDGIDFDVKNKSAMEGLKYEDAHKGEADVETKKKALEEKANRFIERMKALTLDNVPALCKLAERLAQNPVFVETIVNAVRQENDVNEALKKGYSLLADSLLDSDNPLYQEVTSLHEKLADLEEPEAVPIYVTVDKKVPRVIGADLYAANSLWVSMIERAYAASGLHRRELREPESESDQAALKKFLDKEKEILIKQDNPKLMPSEVDYLLAKKKRAYMEDYRRSYKHIEGGSSSEFLETLTGIATQDHSINDIIWKKDDERMRNEVDCLSAAIVEISRSFTHFGTKFFVFDQLGIRKDATQDYIVKMLKNLYKSKENLVTATDLLEHFCKMENWIENLDEKVKDSNHNLDIKELERFMNELREKLPEKIDEAIRDNRLNVQYEPMSGKYAPSALQEYEAIENALRDHIPVGAGTVNFKDGSNTGLNGEPVEGGIVGNHAYAIVGVKEMDGKRFIKMRNPWRAGDTGYVKCTKPGENAVFERVKYNDGPFATISRQKEQGTFYLELNDFLRNVRTIYYNSNQAVTA